jgi:hypothetical protein
LIGIAGPLLSQGREQLRPAQPHLGFPCDALEAEHAFVEPAFGPGALASPRQQQDPEPDLAEDDRTHREAAFVATGWKKPFSGQDSSQSTTPSFTREARRTRRFSPRSTRSTSNSWPAAVKAHLWPSGA